MKAAADQTEILFNDLERRARVLLDCSEKLETQLKVMLVQESRGHISNDLVARIAHALALCLSSRGDTAQAAQYALMASNLERRQVGAHQAVGASPVRLEVNQSDMDSSMKRDRMEGARIEQRLPGLSLRRPRSFASLWAAWSALNRRTAKRPGR